MSAARNDSLGNLEANALSAAGNDRGFAREVKCHDSNPLDSGVSLREVGASRVALLESQSSWW